MDEGQRSTGACLRGLVALALLLALTACGRDVPTPTPILTPLPTATPPVATVAVTPPPGATVAATATATPRSTPPTATRTAAPTPTPAASLFDVTGNGGSICQTTGGGAEQCVPASRNAGAGADDLIKTNPGADDTIGLSTLAVKLRLLAATQLRLKSRTDLSLPERFILETGQVLFDHTDQNGEIVIEAGNLRIQPIDTKFSVSAGADGNITVGVFGSGTIVVTDTATTDPDGSKRYVGANQQLSSDRTTGLDQPEQLSPEIRSLWTTYGVVTPEPTETPTATDTPAPTNTRVRQVRPTATPSATPDTGPPDISNVQAVPAIVNYGSGCPNESANLEISAVVRDPAGVRQVVVQYYYSAGAGATPGTRHTLPLKRTVAAGTSVPLYTTTIPVGREAPGELNASDGILAYVVSATDGQGNTGASSEDNVTIFHCIGFSPGGTIE